MDGIITAGEWSGAGEEIITLSASAEVKILYLHSDTALCFAYLGHLESAMRFPEIYIDPDNSKSAAWEGDDWWFHVSATDCESQGAPSVYTHCNLIQPGWQGVPNISPGNPLTDTVEICIPFSKIGNGLSPGDTIGISFAVTNTFNAWNYWPAGAGINSPATWGSAVICSGGLGTLPTGYDPAGVYPNPCRDYFHIRGELPPDGLHCSILNSIGMVLLHEQLYDAAQGLPVDQLPAGTYILRIKETGQAWQFVKY